MDDKIITIKSKSGTQVLFIRRTSAGVVIAQEGKGGVNKSLHIFEECVPEIIYAFREFGLERFRENT